MKNYTSSSESGEESEPKTDISLNLGERTGNFDIDNPPSPHVSKAMPGQKTKSWKGHVQKHEETKATSDSDGSTADSDIRIPPSGVSTVRNVSTTCKSDSENASEAGNTIFFNPLIY